MIPNRTKEKRRIFGSALIGFALLASLFVWRGLAAVTAIDPDKDGGVPLYTPTSCIGLTLPDTDTDIDAFFEPWDRDLTLTWWDADLGQNVGVIIDISDASCLTNTYVKPYIDQAVSANDSYNLALCADLRNVLSGVEPQDPAKPVDITAAQEYVASRCE